VILPLDRIEARLAARVPGLPDVSAEVAKAAHWYANDWPDYVVAGGLYHRELVRAGIARNLAAQAALEVHLFFLERSSP
jgi:hypothetical protein